MGNIRDAILGNHSSRRIALLVLIAVSLGNLLCDSGTLLAVWMGIPETHCFNPYLLFIGILGMCGFGFALFRR